MLFADMIFATAFAGILLIWLLFAVYIYKKQLTYLLKWFIYPALVLTICLISIPYCLIRGPGKSTNILFFIPLFQMTSKLIGVEWEITGKEYIRDINGPCVVISNHQSALDFLCMCELWPTFHKCVGVAKKGLIWLIPFGPAAAMAGTIFIDRNQTSSAKSTLLNVAENMKIDQNKVFMFPEGTRNKGKELLPFKKGAFHIALLNKTPIIPMVIGPYHFINDKKRWFGRGKVRVTILPPIETEDYELSDISMLAEKLRAIMGQEFYSLANPNLQ